MEGLLASPVTLGLLTANVIASVLGFTNKDFYEQNLFWIAPINKGGQIHRFVTSAFLHVNSTHLLINMYVLWMFGMILERQLGAGGFLLLYFGALLGGNLWEYIDNRNTPDYRAVGASGATSGIVLAFCLFYPFHLLLLFFVIPIWAILFGVGFIVISYILSQRDGTMIAHGAHLGGALAGFAIALLLKPEAWGKLVAEITSKIG